MAKLDGPTMDTHSEKSVTIPVKSSGSMMGELVAALENMRAKGFDPDRMQWRMRPSVLLRLCDNRLVSSTVARTANAIQGTDRLFGIEIIRTPNMPEDEIRLELRH